MNEQPPDYDEAMGSASPTAAEMEAQAPLKGQDTRLALISFSWTDRIRLLRFPEPIGALVSEALGQHWPKGIQSVKPYEESLEIKLRGNPFAHGQDDEKIAIRMSVMGILQSLAREGWIVRPNRLGRMGNYNQWGQKDSLIFDLKEPRDASWLCISFDSQDLVHLINASTDLATALISKFGDEVEKCNKDFVSGIFEVKFKNAPWGQPSPKGSVRSRIIVLDLIQCLEERGYKMGTSLDFDNGSGGSSYQSTGETWFWYR
ncbi:hypothetical protein P175DRAFT_0505492 [Aspergillus ochraceoroseus IBT 24754]|uniref:Uncharacterized protein n=2 Tax=Aspergillus ochraceoroseus TaxID=138278 RepID=A0A2T5M564_9EURO|nr:uncharacterized protein P175DRAFT_0505492 [Aspergillus ochraceoroseus IBT 24754]PTU23680.1 hypothetical protein P175DRAFT_0505492 [Aspergillus ochraceoroseus IBT 24754]